MTSKEIQVNSDSHKSIGVRAFTLIELLVIIAIVGILASLALPTIAKAKTKAMRAKCISNLHQIGISYRTFAGEHENRHPMQVPGRYGGSMEAVRYGSGYTYRHYQVMSNIVVSTHLLVCPADKIKYSTNWTDIRGANLSYFVGVDAVSGNSLQMLGGDRNITNRSPAVHTSVFSTNSQAGWTPDIHLENGNVLFADGHVENLDEEKLQKAILRQVNSR